MLQQLSFENNWNFAKSTNLCDVPKAGDTVWHGFVYAIQFGDSIKIGYATKLRQRMKGIISQAKNYSKVRTGRIAFSIQHTNYRENEKILHDHFQDKRFNNGELFNLGFDSFLAQLPDLELKDESKEMEEKAQASLQKMKDFVLGGKL